MSLSWQDPYEQAETRARQELAALARWQQQSDQELRLLNVGLVGFNLGLAVFDLSAYLAHDGWGYLVGAVLHLATGAYAVRQCRRLYQKETP